MVAKTKGPKSSKTVPAAPKHTKLTDTQLIILSEASQRPDRRIVIPLRLKGNAGNMAFNALLRRRLVEPADDGLDALEQPDGKSEGIADHRRFRVSNAGLQAIGLAPEGPAEAGKTPAAEATKPRLKKKGRAKTRSEKASGRKEQGRRASAPRKGTGGKQQDLIVLLRRSNGATLDELMKASGWQAHSVRGFLSGTVKTKLGLKLERTRDSRRGSIYRVPK
jgi:hypothetical protein